MDWFQGKPTGNHQGRGVSGFNVPSNQSIDIIMIYTDYKGLGKNAHDYWDHNFIYMIYTWYILHPMINKFELDIWEQDWYTIDTHERYWFLR